MTTATRTEDNMFAVLNAVSMLISGEKLRRIGGRNSGRKFSNIGVGCGMM